MKNQYKFRESEQSCKLTLIRRVVMLAVLGLFAWQLSGDFIVSASDDGSNEEASCCCVENDFGFTVRNFIQIFFDGDIVELENALLFGQAPCR